MTAFDDFYKQLLTDSLDALNRLPRRSAAIVGDPKVACRLMRDLHAHSLSDRLTGFYGRRGDISGETDAPGLSCTLERLRVDNPAAVIVAADADKEEYLLAALPEVNGAPEVIIAGYSHFEFRDPEYAEQVLRLQEPSLANGYPNSRIHLYQCLANAARLGLDGLVVEFGMFRGGTTMFLSQTVERLGQSWPILGFDTFTGFPPRQSMLDMYSHEDLKSVDVEEVRSLFKDRMVEVVPGDIRRTASLIGSRPVVVAFIDTDNFTPATAAIDSVVDQIVPGGAIVFDHLTGVDRFRYTLGERIAALPLYEDPRFFNLHGTGVFVRQCVDVESPTS